MVRKRSGKDVIDPAKSVREEFYPRGRKGGLIVRVQTGFYRSGKVARYSLSLIDTRVGTDNGRVLGYDNAHGYHHRHCEGTVESVEFESYESTEIRFEGEVRRYIETGEV